jgi:hypothetical protein
VSNSNIVEVFIVQKFKINIMKIPIFFTDFQTIFRVNKTNGLEDFAAHTSFKIDHEPCVANPQHRRRKKNDLLLLVKRVAVQRVNEMFFG